jgi:hypothetical protein
MTENTGNYVYIYQNIVGYTFIGLKYFTEKTAAGRCRSAPSLSPDIDAGWAWVIAGAALAASAISSGKVHATYFLAQI